MMDLLDLFCGWCLLYIEFSDRYVTSRHARREHRGWIHDRRGPDNQTSVASLNDVDCDIFQKVIKN